MSFVNLKNDYVQTALESMNHAQITCYDYAGAEVTPDYSTVAEYIQKLEKALEKVKAHGCCVMHNDSGCPGCIASDALKL